jgi:hypothetical protein
VAFKLSLINSTPALVKASVAKSAKSFTFKFNKSAAFLTLPFFSYKASTALI